MSGVGSTELILLLLIGLVVLGPSRLPQIANQLGSWIGQARRMTRALRRQLEDELNVDENFRPRPQRAAPSIASPAPDPADPVYDYDAGDHVPGDDDTFSPLHDGAKDGSAETAEGTDGQDKSA